ncbi:hypothetical protein Tco_0616518 [Tanacetum coccineum]
METTRRNSDNDVPNFEAMIYAAVANALPNLSAALRTQITNDIRNSARASGGVCGDAAPYGFSCLDRKVGYLLELTLEMLQRQKSETFQVGAKKWVLKPDLNNGYTNCCEVAAGPTGPTERTRDVMTRDFRGHDQRFTSRNGNDRQGQGNYNQRQHWVLPLNPHPIVCNNATGDVLLGDLLNKLKDCPQAKHESRVSQRIVLDLPPPPYRTSYATSSMIRTQNFRINANCPLRFVGSYRATIMTTNARTVILCILASVMATSLESPNIENLSVVREFADVFPDELPGLPPAREIEFGIELISGAEPISKALYRMAPVELKELKEQLQEMLENGFIRPSLHVGCTGPYLLKKKDGSMRLCNRLPANSKTQPYTS